MAGPLSALDKLKKAANLKARKHEVVLNDGSLFEFWSKPLTMAESERAEKGAASDRPGAFALQLLINKALDANGTRMFNPGQAAELKNEVRNEDLQKCMLAVMGSTEEEGEPMDMKST